jgi:hypothetical protein
MRKKKNASRILVGNLKERDHLEEPGVDGENSLKETGWEGRNLAQDMDMMRSLVHTTNFRFP